MKSFYFKKKDTVLRTIEEEKKIKKQRPVNWDRIIYFILLSTFLILVGRYVFMKIYYVKADGQILFKNLNIQNLDDCRIKKFLVHEGKSVKIGDTLFFYLNDDDDFNLGSSLDFSISGAQKSTWQDKAIIDIEEELSNVKKEIDRKNKSIQIKSKELENISQEVILEILPKVAYYQKETEILRDKEDLEILNHKLISLNEKLRKISNSSRGGLDIKGVGSGGGASDDNLYLPFISPMDGIITKIYKEPNEVALKSEVIIEMQRREDVFIKGFFDQADLKYLQNRNIVEIEFPDGTYSKGRINRFYYSTYRIPEEFQKKYEPTTKSLSVDIKPLDELELKKWHKYFKLSVIVRKKRF
jgi:hypothetical protein